MRYLVRTAPTHRAVAVNRAFNRFFNDEFFRPFASAPTWSNEGWNNLALDVSESDDNLTITASLPGYNPDDVDISIHDGVVTIEGQVESKKEDEDTNSDSKYYLRERRSGSFHRAVRLPVEVNADDAEANFENGVLTLTLPKAEELKPKRIAVQAN
ncbi:MAG: Hsp20/alpha crystallin family protein [Chloroflexota bacterium]